MTNFAKDAKYVKGAHQASWAVVIAWLLLATVGVLIVVRAEVISVRAGGDARSVLHFETQGAP